MYNQYTYADPPQYLIFWGFSCMESGGGKSGGILDVCVLRDSISRFSGAGTVPYGFITVLHFLYFLFVFKLSIVPLCLSRYQH
jgi:hypothetical protein